MTYTVKQLSELANVTVRTLHHYDEIGLLKPMAVASNGYRQYGNAELLKLQQILFFKELDFPLAQIKEIMLATDFDQMTALKEQKSLLELKQERLNKLISTINQTILTMDTNNPEQLYSAFDDAHFKKHQAEVKNRWGQTEAYKQSNKNLANMSKEDLDKIKADAVELAEEIAANMQKGPAHEDVQTLIDRHYQAIGHFYEPNLKVYEGLAKMYVEDQRFAKYYNDIHPELAEFMQAAMMVYIDNHA